MKEISEAYKRSWVHEVEIHHCGLDVCNSAVRGAHIGEKHESTLM